MALEDMRLAFLQTHLVQFLPLDPLTTSFLHLSPLFPLEGNKNSGAPRIRSQITPQYHQ